MKFVPKATVHVLLLLVILPCHSKAHNAFRLDESLKHINKLWSLLNGWLKGLKHLLNCLHFSKFSAQHSKLAHRKTVLSVKEPHLQKFFLVRIALDNVLVECLQIHRATLLC